MGALFRILICFGLALIFARLLITGEIGLFLNPRFSPLIIFSTLLLIAMGLVQIWNLKRPPLHRTGLLGGLLMSLPLITFLLAPPSALDASMAAKKGVSYLATETIRTEQKVLSREEKQVRTGEKLPDQPAGDEYAEEPVESSGSTGESEATDDPNPYYAGIYKRLKTAPVIVVRDEEYIDILVTVEMYNDELKGKPIRLTGFVFRDENMPDGVVLLGRYTMTCCAADASVVGYFSKIPHSDQLKDGTWLEVEGKLSSTTIEGSRVAMILVDSFKRVKAPKDPYVYTGG